MSSDIEKLKVGYIKCGVPPIIGNSYFHKISLNLIKNNLMDRVAINKGSKDLINELKDGNIEIGLIGSLKPIEENNLISKVIKNSYKIIVSKNHPLSHLKEISFKQLKNEQFISLNDHFTHTRSINYVKISLHA